MKAARRHFAATDALKAKWRAAYARHSAHIAPDSSILILGPHAEEYGRYLRQVFGNRISLTLDEKHSILDSSSSVLFDYILGDLSGCDKSTENLETLRDKLNVAGSLILFCRKGGYRLDSSSFSDCGDIVSRQAYDVLPDWLPMPVLKRIKKLAFLLEHSSLGPFFAKRDVILLQKAGTRKNSSEYADRSELANRVSVVIPCHNEEMNIHNLLDNLLRYYSKYLFEIILVDDNSTDRTAETILAYAEREPRVRLVRRIPPNGVGLALREGYHAAQGEYILSMDCDFVETLPELRDLFNAVADGYDGAIGSRFTYESLMVGYPLSKMVCNRVFHAFLRCVSRKKVRDITNNLKLYRAHILKELDIEAPHFAANLETGLKPILEGHRIIEVPVSWINRRADMGSSSFRTFSVGPPYTLSLARSLREARGNH